MVKKNNRNDGDVKPFQKIIGIASLLKMNHRHRIALKIDHRWSLAWALRMHELKRKNWAGSLPSWDAASTSRSLDILLKPVTVSEYKRGLDSSDMIWKWQRYDMKMTMMMTRMTKMTLWVSSCRIWLLRTCHYWDHLSHGPHSDLSDWSFGFLNFFFVQ